MIAVFMEGFRAGILVGEDRIEKHSFSAGDKIYLPDGRNYRVQEVNFEAGMVRGRPADVRSWALHFFYFGRSRLFGGYVRSN
ncbi:hypothetical protein GGP99_001699 [Salinibacter ruber]|uniref:Uncharacterized protein n=2 Tax=Salinibacter ruber TaxID=146919 RepID=A0AAW5P7Z7_9BACT|nr:hypothetical protein [Salinibacter ruber]